MSVKVIVHARKDDSWSSSTWTCENGKYLTAIVIFSIQPFSDHIADTIY